MNKIIILLAFSIIIASTAFAYEAKIFAAKSPSELYLSLGKYYFGNNEFEKSLEYFKKSIETSPSAEAFHNLGIAYYKLEDYDNAITKIKNAIELKNGYAKAYYSLALIYYGLNDHENAIKNMEKVIELEPGNANAHFDLAIIHADRFRKKEMMREISPEDLEDLKIALRYYSDTLQLDQEFPNAQNNAEIIKDAIAYYKEVLQSESN